MIGEVIGNFRVTSRLGAGAMGEVYVAQQTNIDTKVAVKVLRPEISADRAQVDRFFNEARAVGRIKHAGTVKIFDVGFHARGAAYLIMELLEGETLSERIKRLGNKLPLASVCDIGRQITSVLEATHAAGITHRDLKPDNIYLVLDVEMASRERVKILDFGIAKLSGNTGTGPKTIGTMGTPAYMAPEQWADSGKVDWRADIYSLGCVVFEMAAGRPPFVVQSIAEACAAHLSQTPPKLRTVAPDMPEQLEAMIDAMLSKSPYQRPPLREVTRIFDQIGAGVSDVFAETLKPQRRPGASSSLPRAQSSAGASSSLPRAQSSPGASSSLPRAQSSPQQAPPAKKSRAAVYAIGGLVVVGGGIAAVVATSGGGSKTATPDAGVPKVVDAAVVVQVDAPPPKTWTKPAFVDIAGVMVMPQQATRAMYAEYLSTLSEAEAKRARPLDDWDPTQRPTEPVGWVTWEQARAFCRAAGGDLLAAKQWLQASKGAWWIGPPAKVVFSDWTLAVNEGLAEVYGGHSNMKTDADRLKAVKSPLSKPVDSGSPRAIADAWLGIRCTKGSQAAP